MNKELQPSISREEVLHLATRYADAQPTEILTFALARFVRVTVALSGAESAVLIDMATKIRADIAVFTLDTGRLHAETFRFIDRMRERYRLEIDVYSPDTSSVEALVRKKGLFSFYADGHEECCRIRKVEPLSRALASVDAWITGQRRDSAVTRASLPVIELDERSLVKLNPLASWSLDQVWAYVRAHKVPMNELYARGYLSIGCEPCTRSVLPGEDERAGRWWWEAPAGKECGIHALNTRRR